jgi:REP element-mobilizing transposase RayT
MARKLRLQYPGAIYHVLNRGDRREPIFRDDSDRQRFLTTLGETCMKTGWQVHAFCLVGNHVQEKVKTAKRLRSETTMTLWWIAQRLAMGTTGYAAQCLREARRG